jgi:hypothetical protein
MLLLLLLFFSLPLFLSVCVWCSKAQISLFLCKILLAKLLACLLILLSKGFATSRDQHLSISLLKNSINQSGKFQSID